MSGAVPPNRELDKLKNKVKPLARSSCGNCSRLAVNALPIKKEIMTAKTLQATVICNKVPVLIK